MTTTHMTKQFATVVARYSMKLFNKKPLYDLNAIHQYVADLDRVTMLRDKCKSDLEVKRYDTTIEIMQSVLNYILETKEKKL